MRAGDEFFDDRGGLAGFGLVVFGDKLELATKNAAGGVGFFDGETGALVHGLAVGGLFAREGRELADLDGLLSAGEGRDERDEGGNNQGTLGEKHGERRSGLGREKGRQGQGEQVFNQDVGPGAKFLDSRRDLNVRVRGLGLAWGRAGVRVTG